MGLVDTLARIPNNAAAGAEIDDTFSTFVAESEGGIAGRVSTRRERIRVFNLTIGPDEAEEVRAIHAAHLRMWPVAVRDWARYSFTDEPLTYYVDGGYAYAQLVRRIAPETGERFLTTKILIPDESDEDVTLSVGGVPLSRGAWEFDPLQFGVAKIPIGLVTGDITATGNELVAACFAKNQLVVKTHKAETELEAPVLSIPECVLREVLEDELFALMGATEPAEPVDTSVALSPARANLVLTTTSPTAAVSGADIARDPPSANLVLSTTAPTVGIGAVLSPATANLVLTTTAPTVSVSANLVLSPASANLVLTTTAPTLAVSANVNLVPATADLVLTTTAPTMLSGNTLEPAGANLTLSTTAPTLAVTANIALSPAAANLVLSTVAPSLVADNPRAPATTNLTLSSTAPTVAIVSTRREFVVGGSRPSFVDSTSTTRVANVGGVFVQGF